VAKVASPRASLVIRLPPKSSGYDDDDDHEENQGYIHHFGVSAFDQ
jgi:hypothetical protein